MSMPLKKLVSYKGDVYELVSAVIKRSQQITDIRAAFHPTTLEEHAGPVQQTTNDQFGDEKASVIAFREIFDQNVVYKLRRDYSGTTT